MNRQTLLPAMLQAVMKRQSQALHDIHYPGWHLAPVTGLMNDPNGFIYFKGRYHLFYQWNPLSCRHQNKSWGHWSSQDLLHWQHEPIALIPDQEYDRSGCYSGCAIDNHGTLTLCYTGNVKFDNGERTAWQCLAVQNSDGGFDKLGPVIPLPDGYTGHVRDPKIEYHHQAWYMVLAAQDQHKQGKVLLLRSEDLHHWHPPVEIAGSHKNGLADAGYMWECPDLFTLDDQTFLLCCPQGLARQGTRFLNTYSSAYLSGIFDYETAHFQHGQLTELDAGFEFYAPQTTVAADGRRLLIAWMGVPDGEEMSQPTIAAGWIHQMTCFRELSQHQGKLYQHPVRELTALRDKHHCWQGEASQAPRVNIQRQEIILQLMSQGTVTLNFADTLILQWQEDGLQLARRSLVSGQWEHRYWSGKARQLQILCDNSSVEIFINHGEGSMSSRYFPPHPATLTLSGNAKLYIDDWSLHSCMVE
jgi:beta-fructofuranosidase